MRFTLRGESDPISNVAKRFPVARLLVEVHSAPMVQILVQTVAAIVVEWLGIQENTYLSLV